MYNHSSFIFEGLVPIPKSIYHERDKHPNIKIKSPTTTKVNNLSLGVFQSLQPFRKQRSGVISNKTIRQSGVWLGHPGVLLGLFANSSLHGMQQSPHQVWESDDLYSLRVLVDLQENQTTARLCVISIKMCASESPRLILSTLHIISTRS